MAEDSISSTAHAAPSDDTRLVVSLRIISPSAGVPTPLEYPDLPAETTTIGQIRERLRGELTSSNPSQVQLRLIHRGRVLDADDATLLRILGAPAVSPSQMYTVCKVPSLMYHLLDPREQRADFPPCPKGGTTANSECPASLAGTTSRSRPTTALLALFTSLQPKPASSDHSYLCTT